MSEIWVGIPLNGYFNKGIFSNPMDFGVDDVQTNPFLVNGMTHKLWGTY